jgi:hypothetical protein
MHLHIVLDTCTYLVCWKLRKEKYEGFLKKVESGLHACIVNASQIYALVMVVLFVVLDIWCKA